MSDSPAFDTEQMESLLAEAVDEFRQQLGHNEQPDIEEYTARYPQIAGVLRQVLPALLVLRLPSSPPVAADLPPATQDQPIGCLGDFRILREAGRGGMGVVYEAEQISLNRRVALKVLPFAAAMDAKQLQRFKNEAQAAAHLHHQNIVPVYGVGCERGVHYYAMQYIEGQTLATIIGELRQLSGLDPGEQGPGEPFQLGRDLLAGGGVPDKTPSSIDPAPTGPYAPTPAPPEFSPEHLRARIHPDHGSPIPGPGRPVESTAALGALSTEHSTKAGAFFRTVARMGVQAAEALEHAHGLGVIHRDIKPGNLLVDVRGNLWITDFGLAHIHGDTKLTMSGDLLGTIRYMSPEQALAKRVPIDHRTDIYSLGATLYELLVLEAAYKGRDRQEVLRRIAFEEPRPPRRTNKAIPAELETIVLKAMAKNPAERYATAQEMADDLERFLKDEPIKAKPPTLVQKAKKWAHRRQQIVWTAAAAMVLVVAVIVAGLVIGNIRIQEERNEAQRQRDDAQRQRDLARKNFQKAREAVDKYFTQVSEDELLDKPGMQPLRKRLLESALAYYAEFAQQRGDDPALQKDLAEAYLRIGDITGQIMSKADAEKPLQTAIELFEELRRATPDDKEVQGGLAKSYQTLSYARIFGGQTAQGQEPAQSAIAILEKLYRNHLNDSHNSEYGRLLGRSYDLLGQSQRHVGQYQQARDSYRQAISVLTETSGKSPQDPEAKRLLAMAQANFSLVLQLLGDRAQQKQALGEASRILNKLVSDNSTDTNPNPRFRVESARASGAFGQLCYDLGDMTGAEESLGRARSLLEELVKENPTVIHYRRLLALSYGRLGEVNLASGQTCRSKNFFQKAIAMGEELARQEHGNDNELIGLAWWYYRQGCLEADLGQMDTALKWLEKSRDTQAKPVRDNPTTFEFLSDSLWSKELIGWLQLETGQTSAAAQIARQREIIEGRAKIVEKNPITAEWQCELADAYLRLAELHAKAGAPAEARMPLDKALDILERIKRAEPETYKFRRFLAYSYGVQSGIQSQLGDAGAALRSARQAVELLEELVAKESAYVYDLACHRALCSSLISSGRARLRERPDRNGEEPAQAQKYASASIEALRQAVAKGFDNVYKLNNDKSLAPLRSRDDFKQLLRQLEDRVKKEGKQ
jgi:serine/threonine protein kinase/tetratricopeptide (TPR) repeat protein